MTVEIREYGGFGNGAWAHMMSSPPGVVLGMGLSFRKDKFIYLGERCPTHHGCAIRVSREDARLFGSICVLYARVARDRISVYREIEGAEPRGCDDDPMSIPREDQVEAIENFGVWAMGCDGFTIEGDEEATVDYDAMKAIEASVVASVERRRKSQAYADKARAEAARSDPGDQREPPAGGKAAHDDPNV